MKLVADVFLDTVLDCIKMLPFLFAAFLLLEALEHHTSEKMNHALVRAGNWGPLAGALLGFVPQCGFSIMASDFFAGGVISLGTLLSVYLSTSDEALVILLTNPGHLMDILKLVISKIVIGAVFGYLVLLFEMFFHKKHPSKKKKIEDLCRHCGCEEGNGILKPALKHTVQVFLYLFIFTFILNLVLECIGLNQLSRLLLADTVFQPFLAGVIGLIPNCGASVVLTQLYLEGVISFGSVIAGLCASAGLGLLVLFRMNNNLKENIRILFLLYFISVFSGIVLQALHI